MLCWSGAKTESVSENYRFLAHPMGSCAAAAAAAIARTEDRGPRTEDRRPTTDPCARLVQKRRGKIVSTPSISVSDSNPRPLQRARYRSVPAPGRPSAANADSSGKPEKPCWKNQGFCLLFRYGGLNCSFSSRPVRPPVVLWCCTTGAAAPHHRRAEPPRKVDVSKT